MNPARRDEMAARAEHVLRELSLASLPVDPVEIAHRREISVQAAPLEGASGVLVVNGTSFGILYSTRIGNEAYQRFSIAHELGHYHIAGHPEALLGAGVPHLSHAEYVSDSSYEVEADSFAAGLLMPERLFMAAAAVGGSGLDAVVAAANACGTSLVASAIRYSRCTDEPVAVIVSKGRQVEFCFMSDRLKLIPGLEWIRKNSPLPRDSCTYNFNQDPARIRRAARGDQTSDLQRWFGGRQERVLVEEVIGLGSYGKTLTVLSGIVLPDDGDEDEDEELEESWTPRFRR